MTFKHSWGNQPEHSMSFERSQSQAAAVATANAASRSASCGTRRTRARERIGRRPLDPTARTRRLAEQRHAPSQEAPDFRGRGRSFVGSTRGGRDTRGGLQRCRAELAGNPNARSRLPDPRGLAGGRSLVQQTVLTFLRQSAISQGRPY